MTKVNVNSDNGRRGVGCGLGMGILLGIGMVLVLMVGSIFANNEIHQQQYNEPQNNAESAHIEIAMGVGRLEITPFVDSSDLFHADIGYTGELDYSVSGSETKQISLNQTQNHYGIDNLFNLWNINPITNQDALLWAVMLSPDVPLELDIESGIGNVKLDLQELHLKDIQLETGVGSITLALAFPQQSYRVTVESGIGETTIILPQGAAVRFESEIGLGNLQFPTGLERVNGDEEQGIWQTSDFDTADVQITIVFSGGIGNLIVQ